MGLNRAGYNLGYISDQDLFTHVLNTVEKYRFHIDLASFNSNLVDPIKCTFDAGIYQRSIKEIIDDEIKRQIEKSNTNHIGYFHQNIFNYIGDGWIVPEKGFDILNNKLGYYVEIKNKHNTMNSASSQKTYMKMQHKILEDDRAVCMLVEVIAKCSQDTKWVVSVDGKQMAHKNIRRVSMDKFYELVTGDVHAFKSLCAVLPRVIDDVVCEKSLKMLDNSVFSDLEALSPDILHSLYLLSFRKYEGFDDFSFT